MAAILRIRIDNKFLLIRNLHRPEDLSPIGGVVKFLKPAHTALDLMGFVQDPADYNLYPDKTNDLRGTIRTAQFAEFLRWYESCQNRESAESALKRELVEELAEISVLTSSIRDLISQVTLVASARKTYEGPRYDPRQERRQFRHIQVFDLFEDPQGVELTCLLQAIVEAQRTADKPALVTCLSAEIADGRSKSGSTIGGNANYLFRDTNPAPEPARHAQAAKK